MEEKKKSTLFLKLEEVCLRFITGGNITEEGFKEEIDEIKGLILNIEREALSSFEQEEPLVKEEIKDTQEEFEKIIKEYIDVMSIIERFFEDKEYSHIEDGLEKALSIDKKYLYMKKSLTDRRKREVEMKNFLTSQSQQYMAKQLAYKLHTQSFINPHMVRYPQPASSKTLSLNSIKKIAQDLRCVRLFSGLSEQNLEDIAVMVKSRKFPGDSVIFRENDFSKDVYIINSGKISIRKTFVGDNKEEELVLLGRGALLGEMAALEEGRRSATAVAVMEEAEVYLISGQNFLQILEKYPKVSINLNKIYSHRLRETTGKLLKYIQSLESSKKEVRVEDRIACLQGFLTEKPLQKTFQPAFSFTSLKEDSKPCSSLSINDLKYISPSVKSRKILFKKESIEELIKEVRDYVNSDGKDVKDINEKLNDYISILSEERDKLKEKGLPPGDEGKFKEARDVLIDGVSCLKEFLDMLFLALKEKDPAKIDSSEKIKDRAFEKMVIYFNLRQEIKSSLGG